MDEEKARHSSSYPAPPVIDPATRMFFFIYRNSNLKSYNVSKFSLAPRFGGMQTVLIAPRAVSSSLANASDVSKYRDSQGTAIPTDMNSSNSTNSKFTSTQTLILQKSNPASKSKYSSSDSSKSQKSQTPYVCERCSYPCDEKSYAACVCSACRWRILRKVASVAVARKFSTD